MPDDSAHWQEQLPSELGLLQRRADGRQRESSAGGSLCMEPVQALSPGVSVAGEVSGAHVGHCPRH